jgi:hypothetical protein
LLCATFSPPLAAKSLKNAGFGKTAQLIGWSA